MVSNRYSKMFDSNIATAMESEYGFFISVCLNNVCHVKPTPAVSSRTISSIPKPMAGLGSSEYTIFDQYGAPLGRLTNEAIQINEASVAALVALLKNTLNRKQRQISDEQYSVKNVHMRKQVECGKIDTLSMMVIAVTGIRVIRRSSTNQALHWIQPGSPISFMDSLSCRSFSSAMYLTELMKKYMNTNRNQFDIMYGSSTKRSLSIVVGYGNRCGENKLRHENLAPAPIR